MKNNTHTHQIDKTSPIPIYHQIANNIKNRIINNEWGVGDKIPSEDALSLEYNVSRVTLRQALVELQNDGIITKIRGKGSFIKSNPKPFVYDLTLPFTSNTDLEKRGLKFDAKILKFKRASNHNDIDNILKNDGNNLIYIKRLFIFNSRPVALNSSWIPETLVPDILDKGLIDNHLSTTLSNSYNLTPKRVENTIEYKPLSSDDLSYFDVPFNAPVICVTTRSFLSNDVPLEYSKTIWLADRIKFKISFDTNSNVFL